MKTMTPFSVSILAALLWIASPSAQPSVLIYSQGFDGQSAYGPSLIWPADGVNNEVADEFNVVANIDRVVAGGSVWGTVTFQGVHIRFYEFGADNKPGALQREYFLAAGDPSVGFDPFSGEIDAALSPPFAATGRHFLSVQPVINYWYWWSSSSGAPRGEAFYFRNNTIGEAWHHGDNLNFNINADTVFSLYGTVTSAGVITGLSETTLPRSGFLEIFGNNFGGNGSVLIGGISAPVSYWTSTRVIAYVPENAPLGSLPVQVVSSAGGSNTVALNVTTRPSGADHVNWRFRMDGPYSEVRPAIAPDGTVYCVDVFDHLYAIAPDGGLKWLVRGAGSKGVAVGFDGSIYVASESYINAYNPDGSVKWRFVQNPRAFICLGVSVGPDGNIYSVGTQGMGVFSLTPTGTLRWTNPEAYNRPIVDYGEIVFGPNGGNQQLYFYANDHVRALRLDGSPVFTLAHLGQPAIAPDGSVHFPLGAYSPAGSLLWTFSPPYPINVLTPPDVGSDGTHYFGQNLIQLFALNTNGTQRWHATLNGYVGGPIVNPLNTQLLMGSQDTLDHPGFILSASAQNGNELWRLTLPAEDGFNQFPDTRARFTTDGGTAYIITATATGDNNTSKSFVYSLNTGGASQPHLTSAVSRKAHGTAGTFDINLPLTGEPAVECRSSGGNHTLVITFSNTMVSGNASVTSGTGSVAGSPVFNGNSMTVNLTGVADMQKVIVMLRNMTDNSAQVMPDTPVSINILAGDTNGNKTVNASDVGQTKSASGQTITAANFRADVNASGAIGAPDISLVKANAGHSLP